MSSIPYRDTIGRTGRLRVRDLQIGDVLVAQVPLSLTILGGGEAEVDAHARGIIRGFHRKTGRVVASILSTQAENAHRVRTAMRDHEVSTRDFILLLDTDDPRLTGLGRGIPHAE